MKNLFKIIATAALGLACSGCVAVVAMANRPSHPPAYCYDCHAYPGWVRVYRSCNYYVIKTSGDGYYYRPRTAGHSRMMYRGYNAEVVRARQQRHLEFLNGHKDGAKKLERREDKAINKRSIRS